MSVEKRTRNDGEVVWRVRWRDHAGRNCSKELGRKRDADAYDAEIRRRKRSGELEAMDAGKETLDEYAQAWTQNYLAHLAPRTRQVYASTYDLHISPRLGAMPLREFDPDVVGQFQNDLLRTHVGPHAVEKAVNVLSCILQRAVESKRVPSNAARLARKTKAPAADEVRPLAPLTVERMRAKATPRNAAILSVLAYAGLRPGELRGLRWPQVKDRTLNAIYASKTNDRRSVRLLEPLKTDLALWREQSGADEDATGFVFPSTRGTSKGDQWTASGFESWRKREFLPLAEGAGAEGARPYDLRHSFASLLLHEGRNAIYVARQMGNSAEVVLHCYGHVIEELEDAPQLEAEDAIAEARAALGTSPYPQRTHGADLEVARLDEIPANR